MLEDLLRWVPPCHLHHPGSGKIHLPAPHPHTQCPSEPQLQPLSLCRKLGGCEQPLRGASASVSIDPKHQPPPPGHLGGNQHWLSQAWLSRWPCHISPSANPSHAAQVIKTSSTCLPHCTYTSSWRVAFWPRPGSTREELRHEVLLPSAGSFHILQADAKEGRTGQKEHPSSFHSSFYGETNRIGRSHWGHGTGHTQVSQPACRERTDSTEEERGKGEQKEGSAPTSPGE